MIFTDVDMEPMKNKSFSI